MKNGLTGWLRVGSFNYRESEAEDAGREEEGSGLPGSLQGLPQGIHWGDQENTKDQNK